MCLNISALNGPENSITNAPSFPRQLFRMLEEASSHGFDHIVSWQTGGISFKVHKPKQFEREVLQVYFNQTKYKSFQRQVNMYGFRRLHLGPNKGGYASKLFVRSQPDLCARMVRGNSNDQVLASSSELIKVFEQQDPSSTTQAKMVIDVEPVKIKDMLPVPTVELPTLFPSSISVDSGHAKVPNLEPIPVSESQEHPCLDDFTIQSLVGSSESRGSHSRNSSLSSTDSVFEEVFDFDFLSSPSLALPSSAAAPPSHSHHRRHHHHPIAVSPVPSNMVVEETKTQEAIVSSVSASLAPESQNNSFPWKLHIMLEDSEKKNFQHVISWVKDGSAFKVHNRKEFVKTIMPMYFDQTQYDSFRRQLNLYGFTRIARGGERGVVSHPQFVKGCRFLCGMIKRN